MKKTLSILLAAATLLAACTKSEIAYEQPQEIGFTAVAGNITKAVVDGTTYPESLNMYVFAETTDNSDVEPNYINKAEFKHKNEVEGTKVWGGVTPYYWPNVKKLHFAGYSKSGNATGSYSCTNGELKIDDYTPGTGTEAGVNDLMWFPTTELLVPTGYGKDTKFVPVSMYHTCSWITFLVKGDEATAEYTLTNLTITDIDQTADVVCSATASTVDNKTTITPNISWSGLDTKTDSYNVTFKTTSGLVLSTTAINVETNDATTTSGNVVVIPQVPGKLSLTYKYTSPSGDETVETITGIDLALAKDANNTDGPTSWEPGKHYIYTITIKANEILIAPTPVDWTDSNWNITIE